MSLENWPYANVEPEGHQHELYSIAVSLKRIADALPTPRDWFAGQVVSQTISLAVNQDGSWEPENVAYHAYLVADAMLAQRGVQS